MKNKTKEWVIVVIAFVPVLYVVWCELLADFFIKRSANGNARLDDFVSWLKKKFKYE